MPCAVLSRPEAGWVLASLRNAHLRLSCRGRVNSEPLVHTVLTGHGLVSQGHVVETRSGMGPGPVESPPVVDAPPDVELELPPDPDPVELPVASPVVPLPVVPPPVVPSVSPVDPVSVPSVVEPVPVPSVVEKPVLPSGNAPVPYAGSNSGSVASHPAVRRPSDSAPMASRRLEAPQCGHLSPTRTGRSQREQETNGMCG